MKEKILVTGGAGYLGSILCSDLLKLNYKVKVLDNFFYKQTSLNHLVAYDNFEVILVKLNIIILIQLLTQKESR